MGPIAVEDAHWGDIDVGRLTFGVVLMAAGLVAMAIRQPVGATPTGVLVDNPPQRVAGRPEALYRAVLAAIESKAMRRARVLLGDGPDPIMNKVVEWRLLTAPRSGRRFRDIAAFAEANPHWPGQRLLRQRAEEAMSDRLSDAEVLAWFKRSAPITVDGAMRQITALARTGAADAARALARQTWIDGNFGPKQERGFLKRYGRWLDRDVHWQRLDRLLWEGRRGPALRMLRRVRSDYRALAQARLKLRRLAGGVDAAIARVPEALKRDPGLIYERVRWRRSKGMDDDARALLLREALEAAQNGRQPKLWWRERALLARRALAEGDITDAYRLAASHGQTDAAQIAEGEWLAGWIALRFLGDSQIAFTHFQNLYDAVRYPISKARGAYWAGRAAEAGGDGSGARRWYERAAGFGQTYYGQLAAQRLGDHPLSLAPPATMAQGDHAAFDRRELVRVVKTLGRLGFDDQIRPFLLKLTDDADDPQTLELIMALAAAQERTDVATLAAKRALRDGAAYLKAAYPLHRAALEQNRTDRALVHAVIRQESLFDPRARSAAGALGMMQILPSTAKRVAQKLGLGYRPKRLLADPAYNIQLGAGYLDSLLVRWEGSYVLAVASYNAGPARVQNWVAEFGDPRERDVDVVDWVETIPYKETRNYVQRVLEGLTVYRYRLGTSPTRVVNLAPDLRKRRAWRP